MAGFAVCESHFKVVAPGGMTELVRGDESNLLERLAPVVRQESVALDMSGVERIDAAGLAVLIKLYSEASKAGNEFSVTRPGRHVREVLALMGLDRLLICESEEAGGQAQLPLEETAA